MKTKRNKILAGSIIIFVIFSIFIYLNYSENYKIKKDSIDFDNENYILSELKNIEYENKDINTPLYCSALVFESINDIQPKFGRYIFLKESENNEDGINLLMIACLKNKYRSAKLIIEKTANINARSKHGLTPLLMACYSDNSDIAKDLILKGADVNLCSDDGISALFLASMHGNLELVQLLINYKAEIDKKFNQRDFTPLFIAACNNYTNVAKYLLENGADPNCKSLIEESSPLLQAVYNQNYDLTEHLLKSGANVNAKDSNNGNTPLMFAVMENNTKLTQLLLDYNPIVNERDNEGRSILGRGIYHRNLALVKELVTKGADVNSNVNSNIEANVSPLIMASYLGDMGLVHFLVENGAKIDHKDDDGNDALFYAQKGGFTDIVDYLRNNS